MFSIIHSFNDVKNVEKGQRLSLEHFNAKQNIIPLSNPLILNWCIWYCTQDDLIPIVLACNKVIQLPYKGSASCCLECLVPSTYSVLGYALIDMSLELCQSREGEEDIPSRWTHSKKFMADVYSPPCHQTIAGSVL